MSEGKGSDHEELYGCGGQRIELRGRRSEVRGQKEDDRRRKAEDRIANLEITASRFVLLERFD